MTALGDHVATAIRARTELRARLAAEGTDCLRLFHGVTEGAPGIAVDRYGPVLLVQTWREPLAAGALAEIAEIVSRAEDVALVPVWNHRGDAHGGEILGALPDAPIGRELGLTYDVRPRHRGDDPLLFLDLRAGRRLVRSLSDGKRVLNLFSYTCGIGLAAMAGGAREVWNVDFARSALDVGAANATRNGFTDPKRFRTLEADVLTAVRQLAGLPVKGRGARRHRFQKLEPRTFDLVVLDPPRWAKSAFGAVDVVRDYPSLFKPAVLALAPGGAVLATNHVPDVPLETFQATVTRCAEKAGRPLVSVDVIVPEADFPSPDGRPPLKMLLCRTAA